MKNFMWIGLMVAGLTGCETMQVQSRADRASMVQDQLIAQENQRRINGRLETLEMQVSQLSRDLDTLRGQLDVRCAAIERKSEDDKREMVDRLSGELDKLMKQAAARPAAVPGTRGLEHVVQSGETLYIIAKAYGVSTQKLIEANKIQDPSRLSIGQKLFIPQ